MKTPHLDKILATLKNPKCKNDQDILNEILRSYTIWIDSLKSLKSKGKDRVTEMVSLLNEYKDLVEVELIMKNGSSFLYRQKGQLKLDSSINEEFLINLVIPEIIEGIENINFITGPQNAFMSLSFKPKDFKSLNDKPSLSIKSKDQDFIIGSKIFYKFSPDAHFSSSKTNSGEMNLAILAAECKINYDKTMFQECAGTASRLKQGVPFAKYYVLIEFLDMEPEDCRLTDIDNVFLLRHAKRLPHNKRGNVDVVEPYRKDHPISSDVIWMFVEEMQSFLSSQWYDSEAVLKRGSFI